MSNENTPEFRYADETQVRVSQLMLPGAANSHGSVHGGEMLKLVDSIAYVCASRFSGGLCVTAAVDRIDFHEPILVGELVNLVARVCYVGKTSLEVEIDVFAEDIPTGRVRHTNSCYLTMVHLEDGRPAPVPRLVCRTREDKARWIQAKMRRDLSARQCEERERLVAKFDQLSEEELDRLVAG